MTTDNWFYASGGQQLGPVSLEVVRQMAASGQLRREDLVWTEGLPQWVVAGTRQELFAPPAAAVVSQAPALPYVPPYAQPLGYQSSDLYPRLHAGFWLRVGAYVIDYIILFVANLVLGVMGGLLLGFAMAAFGNRTTQGLGGLAGGFLGIIFSWLYHALMESSARQATVGKLVCGIIVMDLNGGRLGFGQATGRHFAKILSGIILCIGFMMAGWTEKKQGLHDIVAGTLVVRK